MPLLNADTKSLIQSFIDESEKDLIRVIESNHKKFPSWEKLIKQYRKSIVDLFHEGSTALNRFQELHNEVCTAAVILEDNSISESGSLEYEPKTTECEARFDFRVTVPDIRNSACAFLPKAGAQCGSSARWDLSGGRRVTGVPTGIIIYLLFLGRSGAIC